MYHCQLFGKLKLGCFFLGGLPTLNFLAALIVEEILVEFIKTKKTSTSYPNSTNTEVGEEEALMQSSLLLK